MKKEHFKETIVSFITCVCVFFFISVLMSASGFEMYLIMLPFAWGSYFLGSAVTLFVVDNERRF